MLSEVLATLSPIHSKQGKYHSYMTWAEVLRIIATWGLWCLEGKLVESDNLTSGSKDTLAGSLSDTEGTQTKLSLG